MKVIRFEVEGLINSFRIPFFRTYHKSFLAPPKTTVIGMLCNISLKAQKEFFELLDKDLIKISVIINDIQGRAKDLWSYKTLEKKNMGKSVVRRDRLFLANYTIYLSIDEEELYSEIFENLKNPKNIPSLGLDDEIVNIKSIKELEIEENISNRVDSIFLDRGHRYKAYAKDITKIIELPTINKIPTKFIAFDKKGKRVSKESIEEFEFNQVEFLNCEIEFQSKIDSFIDEEFNNRLVFY